MKINISESHYLDTKSDKSDAPSESKDKPKPDTKEDGVRTLDGTFVPWSRIRSLLKWGAK